ncbi:tRNA-guanine transglycosylase [Histoplasma capsulatum var. duboisii H88]|uniref:Queuine tRNA-ribosyltransferase accessory subunit 2 n=2 Tax=Ajellomyces capsulatus TaxID=5037 RepID=F0UPZ5_AJEC8|nr:tRNA guanine transglycosylase [Histoplasma capsulatum H143]EGC47045.1 tRNA-guanine transglycosylase [Histoplasma capsulatum var. duboisii H88]QSS53217.1 tRNA-guanine transglycosylase [Histoplasma capsulatum var. duboisii H88]
MQPESLAELPDEMFSFSLLGFTPTLLAPRLGRLALTGRKPIQTPNHVPITSRGVLPHVSHDIMNDRMSIGSLYAAFEDFAEKGHRSIPPIYQIPTQPFESALRKFICQREDLLLILGPRRVPPVPCPTPNSSNSVTILSSVGYRQLETEQYIEAIQKLQPDIAVGLSDLSSKPPGVKRRERMVDRTHAWTRDAIDRLYDKQDEERSVSLFLAPLLPLDKEQQMLYIQELEDEMRQNVAGFAVYDTHSTSAIPESMSALVRLSLSETKTPREILKEVSLGIDLSTVPFVGEASDAGIALDFVFPSLARDVETDVRPLGIDMWTTTHAADMSPLSRSCKCYTCQKFSRAYIRHLLHAKEMLSWTLLQIHNYHVLDNFYVAIRDSIARGTFDEDVAKFERAYEPELPRQSGQGPRLRGYQFKGEAGAKPKNPKVYGRLDQITTAPTQSGSSIVTPNVDAHGFGANTTF